jgi:hypothetical protein
MVKSSRLNMINGSGYGCGFCCGYAADVFPFWQEAARLLSLAAVLPE